MPSRKFSEEDKAPLKNVFGWSDEELEAVEENPKQFELFRVTQAFAGKQMVATCVEAEKCGMHKIGDKYVFTAGGRMIKDDTCERPCLWAMSTFFPFSYILYDRAASGLDPAGMHFEYVSCPDTGCRYGGYGTAMFKISVEDA